MPETFALEVVERLGERAGDFLRDALVRRVGVGHGGRRPLGGEELLAEVGQALGPDVLAQRGEGLAVRSLVLGADTGDQFG